MRRFFYPSGMAVFGAGAGPRNLAKNIIHNCLSMGYQGALYPVGRNAGTLFDRPIITNADDLPLGIDLAVILVPADEVAATLDICGRKGIRKVIISTGGFREFQRQGNRAEAAIIEMAKRHNIRFIGPNCIGVICTESGLCTPFAPFHIDSFKSGPVSIIAQSGGVASQSSYTFSEAYIGFSKIISMGNKLNLNEIDFIRYLMDDEHTEQIHLYLESIDHGRELIALARRCPKPIVIFKSNVSQTASRIAQSHTAALANNDKVVDAALKQAGVVRVDSIQAMTVCAKALRLPPLRGNRLVALSLSGGFSVILGDACEKQGFVCPELPGELLREIESHRRGGIIKMSNPMDFGDVHTLEALQFAVERCLALDHIDGMALCFMYGPEMARMLGKEINNPTLLLDFVKLISDKAGKPIALSFFSEKEYIEQLKADNTYPVFNTPEESVAALKMRYDYTLGQQRKDTT